MHCSNGQQGQQYRRQRTVFHISKAAENLLIQLWLCPIPFSTCHVDNQKNFVSIDHHANDLLAAVADFSNFRLLNFERGRE